MGIFDLDSGPAVRFKQVGDGIEGEVKRWSERQATEFTTGRPKVNDRDQPVMMAVIELQCDKDPTIIGDDGLRVLYAEKFLQLKAIAEAFRATGAKDLEVGGRLGIYWTGEEPSSKGNPLKTWRATYTRPAGGSLLTSIPVTEPAAPAVAEPDLVAVARAAQVKAAADRAAMEAKAAAPVPPTNGADPTADLLKIRELSKLGFEASAINAAMPNYSMDAIAAVLAV